MNQQDKMAIRAAAFIHEELASRRSRADEVQLPEYAWQQLQRLKRDLERTRNRGWRLAEKVLRGNMGDAMHRVQYELEDAVRRAQANRRPRPVAGPADIYRDLVALRREFEGLEIDLTSHELAVTTDCIVLEGIDLGHSEIRLDLSQIGASRQPYRAIALDPHPAARNEGVTHPHVQDERLCEGEGRTAIAGALAEGRIYDFFVLVSQVLHTYGRGSAYIELDRWGGVLCDDCGDLVDDEDRYGCQRCGDTLCPSCAIPCQHCEEMYCGECIKSCSACGENYCSSCLSICSGCRKRFCDNCLEDGLCRECQEKLLEEEEQDEPNDNSQYEESCPAGQANAELVRPSV